MFASILFPYIIVPVFVSILSILLTYFISTRDMESTMNRISRSEVKSAIEIHDKIKHKDDPWDIVDKKIKEHKESCGLELKQDIKRVETKVDKLIDKLINGIN